MRVIAATHQDLEARVRQGLFREDLLHRLNVIRIEVPPLRQRREDIPSCSCITSTLPALELGVAPKTLTRGSAAALIDFRLAGQRASARQRLPPPDGDSRRAARSSAPTSRRISAAGTAAVSVGLDAGAREPGRRRGCCR